MFECRTILNRTKTQTKKISLRILSYNIHKGFSSYNRKFVLEQIRAALHKIHPDLILLQEVVGKNESHSQKVREWPNSSQFEYLAEKLWPHFAYGKTASYTDGHHGNAILSKFPISKWENLDVSTHPLESRGILHGLIQLPHQAHPLHVICTHLGLLERTRQRQTQSLCDRIKATVPKGESLVVAGDFNDWREQVSMKLQSETSLSEVFFHLHRAHARTFPSWLPFLPLDRIYFRGMTPLSAECLVGKPWNQLSDHSAVCAVLKI